MFLPKDHPLICKHEIFITNLMQELPFSSWEDSLKWAKAETDLLESDYLILYPQEKNDILYAICDHIIQKTDNYMHAHHNEYKGVEKYS